MHGSQVAVDHVGWPYRQKGLTSAQLNLPFCIATLLLEGEVFVDQFAPAAVEDAARIALSRRVGVVHDPAITALGSKFRHKVRVELPFRDGTVEEETREAPRGSERSFATEADIVEKFRKLTKDAPAPSRRDALVELVLGLEKAPAAKRLAELLATG